MDKAASGIAGLDRILFGGFLTGDAVLLKGAPGTGKTTVGMQCIHNGATKFGEPGLIITFEEFPQQLYRDAANFGWDLHALIERGQLKVIPTSPEVFRKETGEGEGLIGQRAKEIGATRVLIDSVSHFHRLSGNEHELRDMFTSFINMLKRKGFTSLMTMEVGRSVEEVSFEEYVVDAVVRLTYESVTPSHKVRFLEVLKARGQEFMPGKHSFAIGGEGVRVFPVEMPRPDLAAPLGKAGIVRLTTGITGLDEMLEGGLIEGFTNLIGGAAGTGKTCFALHFVAACAMQRSRALLITTGQRPETLFKLAESIGIDMGTLVNSGWLLLLHVPPVNIDPNQLLSAVRDLVTEKGVSVLVVDSLTDIEANVQNSGQFRQFTYLLINLAHQAQATSLFITELPEEEGQVVLNESVIAPLADVILSLRCVEVGGEIRRGVGILKMRGSGHHHDIRPYRITTTGVVVERRRKALYQEYTARI